MSSDRDTFFTLGSVDEGRSLRLPNLQVVVTSSDGKTASAPLGLDPVVLGQGSGCDVVVADPRVSRAHCEIRLTDKGILLRDLQSRNGTFVHGMRIIEVFLDFSATVTIGSSMVVVKPLGGAAVLPLSAHPSFGSAVGESLPMRALFAKLERIAPTDETVLLLGESGTGKEVLARAIHEKSRRHAGPFVVVDCGAIAASVIDAELFGTVKGAATGAIDRAGMVELAEGGTLFIDELGELPLDLQQKFLRTIEDRKIRRLGAEKWQPIDVRIIAATHRNLRSMVNEGKFRQDLYFRLSVLEVGVPPLRERKSDIPVLVKRFLANRTPQASDSDLPPDTIPMLMSYDWPGNVRELRNVVARIVLFPELLGEILAPKPDTDGANAGPNGSPTAGMERFDKLLELSLPEAREAVLAELERNYVAAKLRQFDGNITKVAEAVGVSRQLLHRLLERHGMKAKW